VQTQVHARLIELHTAPPHQDALHGSLEGDAEIESRRGLDGEAVELPNPLAIHATHHVPGEGCVNIPVAEHHCSRFQQWDNVVLDSVRKIRSVKQGKRGGGEHLLLLSPPRGVADERRGIPFAEDDPIAFCLQPLVQQHHLGGLARTVDAFNHKELSRETMLAISLHSAIPRTSGR